MILITTSRRPTQRVRTLCNDLRRVIPNSIKISRGKLNKLGVCEKARELGSDHILIVERWKGGPGRLQLHVTPFKPDALTTLDLRGVRMQREIGRRTVVKRDLAVTVANNVSVQIRHLAYLFSQFLGVQLLDDSQNTECEASAHFTSMRERDLKIAFTMPPRKREIGPILTVRLHSQPPAERFP